MYKALLNQPIGTLKSELLYQPETNHFTPSSFCCCLLAQIQGHTENSLSAVSPIFVVSLTIL